MIFQWTDDDGRLQDLMTPAPIIAAADVAASRIDRLIPAIESDDIDIRDTARRALAPLQAKLERLQADLERWNAHADRQTRSAAMELVERIDALPTTIAGVTLVVALHDEHDQLLAITDGAPKTRADMLAGHMTVLQRRAFITIDIRSMPAETMTRGEGKALLDAEPRFARRHSDTDGWFAWTDRTEHAHRIVDPLPIEREIVVIAGELTDLRAALGDHGRPDVLFATVETALTRWQRLIILKEDLERFGRAADARDLDACKRYAADWRSKRTKA